MSDLAILKDKDPKEVARLLTAVSSSLLPNPGITNLISQTNEDPTFVSAVLNEIREQLSILEGDNSVRTKTRIYAFLSEELSKAALANTNLNTIKNRLGDKGELHPSEYQIVFDDKFVGCEALGISKSHVTEAVIQPDQFTNLKARYTSADPKITISTKLVTSGKAEENFILLIFSARSGQTRVILAAFRVYHSEIDLRQAKEPIDVLMAFVDTYGLHFRIGDGVYKLMHNDMAEIPPPGLSRILAMFESQNVITVSDGQKGDLVVPVFIEAPLTIRGTDSEEMSEFILGFVLNVSEYVKTLRKHHVRIWPESKWNFARL